MRVFQVLSLDHFGLQQSPKMLYCAHMFPPSRAASGRTDELEDGHVLLTTHSTLTCYDDDGRLLSQIPVPSNPLVLSETFSTNSREVARLHSKWTSAVHKTQRDSLILFRGAKFKEDTLQLVQGGNQWGDE